MEGEEITEKREFIQRKFNRVLLFGGCLVGGAVLWYLPKFAFKLVIIVGGGGLLRELLIFFLNKEWRTFVEVRRWRKRIERGESEFNGRFK